MSAHNQNDDNADLVARTLRENSSQIILGGVNAAEIKALKGPFGNDLDQA